MLPSASAHPLPTPHSTHYTRMTGDEESAIAPPRSSHSDPRPGDATGSPRLLHSPSTQAAARANATLPLRAGATAQADGVRSLESQMARMGVTLARLRQDIQNIGGKFIQSASQGKTLASLNDHAGIIVFPARHKGVKITEMLAVIKDTVANAEGLNVDRYFVKGYGNRLVPLSVVADFRAEDYEGKPDAGAPAPTEMETSFRTHLRKHSEAATLYARNRADQSDRPVMTIPPNPLPLPRMTSWAMSEQSLHSFGDKPTVEVPGHADGAASTRESDFHRGYVDYNGVENRLIFFLNKDEVLARRRPFQMRPAPQPAGDGGAPQSVRVPASVNMDGPVLAQIQGIKRIETIGPAGAVEGVKLASFRAHFERNNNKVLRITTEDDAVHELTYTPQGATLKRVHPAPGANDPMTPLDNADISLYFYQGANTGPHGSLNGYADPELAMSTGEMLPAGTLLSDPTGGGMLKAAAKAFTELLTLAPSFGNHDGWSGAVINTGIQATMTAASVYLANTVLDKIKAATGGTLVPGANVYSASGAGHVTPLTLAGAVAPIVVVQKALTYGVAFIIDKLPHSVKSRENGMGQLVNELVLPWIEETGRLMINYGLEKRLGLPRGNTNEMAALLLTSALTVTVRAAHQRMGDPENHPWLDAVAKATEFVLGDLVGRSLGAVVGSAAWQEEQANFSNNFRESYVTRAITRGYDKAAAPMLRTMLNALGWTGPNASAYDEQLNQEARFTMAGALRSWSHDITKALDVAGEQAVDKLQYDIEATAGPIAGMKKAAHRLHQLTDTIVLRARQADQDDTRWVEKALAYQNETDPAARAQILREFEAEIAHRVALSEGAAAAQHEVRINIQAITNNAGDLPENMRNGFEQITQRYLAQFADDGAAAADLYPLRPASNFLSAPLPNGAVPSTRLGRHTERIVNDLSTFTREPARFIKTIHDAMVTLHGVPDTPAASLPNTSGDNPPDYRPLTPAILRQQWEALVSYTVQSSPFHYKFRWGETGQNHFAMLADGIPVRTTVMNERGNVTGDRGRQVTGRMALLVNHAILHGKPHPTPVVRAVVTEASYREAGNTDGLQAGDAVVNPGDQVSLTEIFSATSSSLLAASFLAPQGFNAADSSRRARIVIDNGEHEPVAVSISRETDLKQAESLLMPGTSFIVSKIVTEPAAPAGTGEPAQTENLGQVIHFKRVNLWQAEALQRRYDALSDADKQAGLSRDDDGRYAFDHAGVALTDGTLTMDKDSGAFFRFNGGTGRLEPHQAKNYFLGANMENPGQHSRTRHPFTAESSPRGLKDEINAMLLLGDSAVPYLDDMTKNVSYEIDRRAGGYYTRGTDAYRFKQQDDARRAAVRAQADAVAGRIVALDMDTVWPPLPLAPEQAFPGQLLAETAASALRQPLQMVQIDERGQLVRQPAAGGADGARSGQPVVLAHIAKGYDGVDLRWEKQGHALIGVGPNGYYHMRHQDGELTAAPVRINADGHTPGNLLHAIAAAALPNPAESRYRVHQGSLNTTHQIEAGAGQQNNPAEDVINSSVGQLLHRLKAYVSADYQPMQAWLSRRA